MTRLIHFSDPHENAVFPSLRGLFDKRIFGYMNGLKRRMQHNNDLLDRAIRYIVQEKPDGVIFTVDAVSTADPREFEAALPHYQPLIDSGIPVICTPGNHDLYVRDGACRRAMEKFYAALADNDCFKAGCRKIGNLRVISLPEARPVPIWLSCGYLSAESIQFVLDEVEKEDPSPILLAGHFPILEDSLRRGLRNVNAIRELLRSGKIALSLCGHIHKVQQRDREWIAGSVSRYGSVTEVLCESGQLHITRHSLKDD